MLKLSRNGSYGAFKFLLLFPAIIIGGCDLFNVSLAEHFLNNNGSVEAAGFTVKTTHAVHDGRILIPSGDATIIGVALFNPRNFKVRQELLGAPPEKNITARLSSLTEIEVTIAGAVEGDDYGLTLVMQSPDGLRDFPSYSLRVQCVSFETKLQDFTIDGERPASFDPAKESFRVDVPNSRENVTFGGTAAHSKAMIAIYAGTDDSGELLVTGDYRVTIEQPLTVGANDFCVKITAPSTTTRSYAVVIYRGSAFPNTAKAITTFAITNPASAAGVIDGEAKTIAVTVPYGTDVTAMTAAATHTGASILPDPAEARDYTSPATYTVTAEDGSAATYTVTVTV
jgi:hypothetical protein